MRTAILATLLLSSAAQDPRPTIVLVSGEFEYESKLTLPALKRYLEARYPVNCVTLERREGDDIPGLDALEKADLALFYVRRMTLPPDQMAKIRKYVDSGRPLLALRTSSHAFENWKEFDREVLGGNYKGHYGNKLAAGAQAVADHPILRGVDRAFPTGGSLYKTSPLGPNTTLLLTGTVEGQKPEPAAWTNTYKGAKVFYSSLGHPKDFEAAPFRRMLVNAIFWALGREVPEEKPGAPAFEIRPPPPGLTPAESLARMKPAPGTRASLFAHEPDVRQPVAMNWDDRGRMWVVEYLQYPHPAGLKALEWDVYFRTKWDRVPEPPPKGPRGADRIRILEDTDGDGKADTAKVFVEGLNLATGVAVGHGGVYVCQAPYLLFYPDRNADDLPDGPPEVLVKGFGMEDSHAYVNSLAWGPDGWLYGAHGSTVTARIGPYSFQQGIWRFHPRTREFELFAEGGGNTWSYDWDPEGQLVVGTNHAGSVMLHQVQGGYYIKGFEKHGPLSNPYSFGYFPHCEHRGGFKGGHVTIGGLTYQADALPLRGKHVAANILSNAVYWHDVEPVGSTFATRQGGDLMTTDDPCFRPVDLTVGPDGALYVADWYDIRATHNNTREDNWDKTTGRIYRIDGPERKPAEHLPLSKLASERLVSLLGHPNEWYHREAKRILAERRDASVVPLLRDRVFKAQEPHYALECLWALYVSGGFDDALALQLLAHRDRAVRAWTVRLLGDARSVSAAALSALVERARTDPEVQVRSQLACTAKRLPADQALPVLAELVKREEDAADRHLPLLLWWAIEHHVKAGADRLIELLVGARGSKVVREHLLQRLARRLSSAGEFEACARLLEADASEPVLSGIELGLAGRAPDVLKGPISRLRGSSLTLLKLSARLGNSEAQARIRALALDAKASPAERVAAVQLLAQTGQREALLELLGRAETDLVLGEVLKGLGGFAEAAVADALVARLPGLKPTLRDRAIETLVSRKDWARKLVETLGAEFKNEPVTLVQKVLQHKDAALAALVEKHWGRVQISDKAERIKTLSGIVGPAGLFDKPGRASDRARGKEIFVKRCAACHTLFGEGGKIGPDLTALDRRNVELLMQNIVDPGAVVRKEYANFNVVLKDERILTGLVVDPTPETLTIVDAKGEKTVVPRAEIREGGIRESQLSLMPEALLDDLDTQGLVDLFSYLTGSGRRQEEPAGALPGTKRLDRQGDLSTQMVAGIDAYLTRELAAAPDRRKDLWKQDFSSREAYEKSVAPNRERFRKAIGAVDPRKPGTALEYVASTDGPANVGRGRGFSIFAVRWPVFEGVEAEGLLLQPDGKPTARVVAVPDADQTPEQFASLASVRRLAENGEQVLIPVLIDRSDTWSGHPRARFTNQPHREFVYRAAFEMGRHVIGYEVQKVLAAVDWFLHDARGEDPTVKVVGYGEGGLVAFYAAAADTRVDEAVVRAYFQEREGVWQEPIYRNVWNLVREFGDAGVAWLVAPRRLVIEEAEGPKVDGPPKPREGRSGAAPGKLGTPSGRSEFERARPVFEKLGAEIRLVRAEADPVAAEVRPGYDPLPRLRRQFEQLNEFTQRLVRESEFVREKFFGKADRKSLDKFVETSKPYRDYLWEEVIGKLPAPGLPPSVRTRQAYDEPAWRGYEVTLDLYPDVYAYGILLVPKDLKEGERRPVVVCQHGLEGRPQDTITKEGNGFRYYKSFAAKLAERGFVVYAPQNPYLGQDKFRVLQRKANPLKLSLFSFIVRQHERTLDWLAGLPYVDPARIGFYGLSYGGKTAVRVPTILSDKYALSICSADYNEWVVKNTSITTRYSYMFTGEYEMFEFDLGHTFNYAEMSYLMVPRPFMVERGHSDGVAPDEWVAHEYAKVRRLYDQLGIGERTEIEFFNGPHEIHGKGTFDFLHRHLKWPERR